MKNIIISLLILAAYLLATQSIILEVSGTAAMGDSKSRQETISEAKANAKRNASENALTYISSTTTVKDFMTEKDLIEAYSMATVKILEELNGEWFKDDLNGESYKITLKAEVIPQEFTIKPEAAQNIDSPTAPLKVKLWTNKDQKEFKSGEKIDLFIQGNKPFFAKVLYLQSDNAMVQLLPNPFRKENYFEGQTIFRLPSGKDEYELVVSPPFGTEKIVLYASSVELGEVKLVDNGPIYSVSDDLEQTNNKTRGIKISQKGKADLNVAEFCQVELIIKTKK